MKCLLCCEKSDILLTNTEQKDKKNAEDAGETYRRKVIFSAPQNSPILNSSNKALVKEKESLHKLIEVPYLIPKRKTLYTMSLLNRLGKTSRREI